MGGGHSRARDVRIPPEQLHLIVPSAGSFNKRAQFSDDSETEDTSPMTKTQQALVQKGVSNEANNLNLPR